MFLSSNDIVPSLRFHLSPTLSWCLLPVDGEGDPKNKSELPTCSQSVCPYDSTVRSGFFGGTHVLYLSLNHNGFMVRVLTKGFYSEFPYSLSGSFRNSC